MEEDQRIRIGGIKFSEELSQFTLTYSPDSSLIYQLLHLIAKENINIPFLCHSNHSRTPESIFCVDQSNLKMTLTILKSLSIVDEDIRVLSSVGTLTLFPHRNSFLLLGAILHTFGLHGFALHALSTSISAIAINSDYSLLDEIASKLQSRLELPENHAPFRQGFRLTQVEL